MRPARAPTIGWADETASPPRRRRPEQEAAWAARRILALQRAAGNQAVTQLLSGPPVIQRLAVKVALASGSVSSVSFPNKSRPGGNIRGHQGDHTTAFASFLRMVRNQIMGQPVAAVPKILEDLVMNLKGFPGMQIASADYLHRHIEGTLVPSIRAISTKEDIEAVLYSIVDIRNQMPLSAILHSTSTGGHGEGSNVKALQECEDRYRHGSPAPRYTPDQMTEWMWDIFDYDPSASEDTDVVINVMAQHIYSMHMTFPNIFKNIDGYDRMVKYYKATSAQLLPSLDATARRTVLAGLQGAVTTGPSALPRIGKSKLWVV